VKLTLADKLALIYTSAGSQRGVAALVGISHQKVGRILHAQMEGTPLSDRVLKDPGLIAAIDQGFAIHKQVTREQARIDGIPFDPAIPVFVSRMPRYLWDTYIDTRGKKHPVPKIDPKTGRQWIVPGDRAEALHMHWMRDALRERWIVRESLAGKYAALSIGSIVNLKKYNAAAQRLATASSRNPELQAQARNLLSHALYGIVSQEVQDRTAIADLSKMVARLIADERTMRIQSRITPLKEAGAEGIPLTPDEILGDINLKLREKQQPAATGPGTRFADRILFQIDTRFNRDEQFRNRHQIPKRVVTDARKAKPGKPRHAAGGTRKGKARKKA
jgi:hypothetical protein